MINYIPWEWILIHVKISKHVIIFKPVPLKDDTIISNAPFLQKTFCQNANIFFWESILHVIIFCAVLALIRVGLRWGRRWALKYVSTSAEQLRPGTATADSCCPRLNVSTTARHQHIPSTNIYTRWSSWRYGIGCHAPMVYNR